VQEEADERHRNASFVAVGVLVPSHGRLGRAWAHADELVKLAGELVREPSDTRALELFWQKHKLDENAKGGDASPSARRESLVAGLKRKRRPSDASGILKPDVSAKHPALHMPALLDSFGPLLFPLYRAALLRKRILLLGSPPVQRSCDAVYILSILASIPPALGELLQEDIEPLFRAQPLFSVGVHDIPELSSRSDRSGWIATTTDDILGEKHQLYDVLVELAPAAQGTQHRWPKIRTSDGKVVKGTQRDLRRYRLLRSELKRMQQARQKYRDSLDGDHDSHEHETRSLMRSGTGLKEDLQPEELQRGESEIVEPVSWTAMAYDSFMWWASAGEQDAYEKEETSADRELLDDLPRIQEAIPLPTKDDADEDDLFQAEETATVLTAYFHRMTSLIIRTLAGIVEEADDETEEGIEEDTLAVSAEDMKRMGLDAWSEADKDFVREAMKLYLGRDAAVADNAVRMCGVRVC